MDYTSNNKVTGEIILYQPDDTIRLEVRIDGETVWLTQAQMVELFQRDVSVISRHIANIFKEGELEKESNLHFLQIAFSDKPVVTYSLDVNISVGYRILVLCPSTRKIKAWHAISYLGALRFEGISAQRFRN